MQRCDTSARRRCNPAERLCHARKGCPDGIGPWHPPVRPSVEIPGKPPRNRRDCRPRPPRRRFAPPPAGTQPPSGQALSSRQGCHPPVSTFHRLPHRPVKTRESTAASACSASVLFNRLRLDFRDMAAYVPAGTGKPAPCCRGRERFDPPLQPHLRLNEPAQRAFGIAQAEGGGEMVGAALDVEVRLDAVVCQGLQVGVRLGPNSAGSFVP